MLHLELAGNTLVWARVGVGVGAYLMLLLFLRLVTTFVYGKEGEASVAKFVGLPLALVLWVLLLTWRGISWPWRYRNRRILREAFGDDSLDPEWALLDSEQEKIDRGLQQLALHFQRVCNNQEKSRKTGDQNKIRMADEEVARCKEGFWSAYNVAKRWFKVRENYKDYLPEM